MAAAVGLVAIHERLRFEFDPAVAATVTFLLFAGSSLFWTMTREGALVETAAFAIVALVSLAIVRQPRRGVAIALWSVAVILPIGLRLGGLSPIGGEPPVATPGWSGALFSSTRGLLSLTPVAYLGLAGTLLYASRAPGWAAAAVATLLVWLVALALSPPSLTDSKPFGHGLTAALALVAPGLAFVVDRARTRPWLAIVPLVAAALMWNYGLMVQYTIGLLPKDAPVSFGSMVRQQADIHTRSPYIYPFAFPANLAFRLREGLPAERYELLAFEPRYASLDLAMDRRSLRFLLDGWQPPGPDDTIPVQWIRERRASLAVPLDLPDGRDVDVVISARARLEEPAVNAKLALEINGHPIGSFIVPPTAPVDRSLGVPASAVGRIWRAGYNRVAFVSEGVERADPSDARPAGPLGSRAGDRAWPVAIYRIRIHPR